LSIMLISCPPNNIWDDFCVDITDNTKPDKIMIKKNIQTALLILISGLLISLSSCDPGRKFEREEKAKIQDYLSSNSNLNFVLKPSGLYYLDIVVGTGPAPVKYDSAFIKYSGKFLDGVEFDSNVPATKPFGYVIGQNIVGFDEGVLLMKEGGKAKLLIPSALAYGSYGSYPYISGYTPLLFDVELVRVKAAVK
jgi:FKBP-type peptidyl-prolyl cis-trans isomerase